MNSVENQYWESGLHDAYIEKAERGFCKDYGKKYLKFFIDASGAVYDQSVKSITFFNYKLLKGNYNASKSFWMSDELKKQDGKYILEIDLVSFNYKNDEVKNNKLIIEFENMEVIRSI